MNKICTSIEQSKKLAEILPLESADMHYWHKGQILGVGHSKEMQEGFELKRIDYIPCWSLAALLDILPKGTSISTPNPINELSYCCWNHYHEIHTDNPVDACYEMIVRLNELNLL